MKSGTTADVQWQPTFVQVLRAVRTMIVDLLYVAATPSRTRIRFKSAARQVLGTIYDPGEGGPWPAVLVFPTAIGTTPHEHAIAARLAKECYLAFVIAHVRFETGAVIRNSTRRDLLEQAAVDAWLALRALPEIDPTRIFALGFSLGGYFASHLASLAPPLRGVVLYYGAYQESVLTATTSRVPLLLFQGRNDSSKFVTCAEQIEQLAPRLQNACKVVWYEGAGHQFDLFDPGTAAAGDAWVRTLDFLKQYSAPC